mgnify:CR=1 FL=1
MPPTFFPASLEYLLLTKGYFPKELPPPFNTRGFGDLIRKDASAIPALPSRRKSSLMMFNLARPGMLRRRLALPHPREYYALAKCICDNFTAIDTHIRASPFSISTPQRTVGNFRAFLPRRRNRAVVDERIAIRKGSRFLVRADINHFYPSIYTHTIPWALHSKTVAKEKRNDKTLLGNILDKGLSTCQHDQTRGIPIGPDTSFIIGELLLASVDQRIKSDLASRKHEGLRFYDDFEFGCESLSDAHAIMNAITSACAEFELELSSPKSSIIELPHVLGSPWTRVIDRAVARVGGVNSLVHLHDLTIRLSRRFPTESIHKYTIGKMIRQHIRGDVWPIWEQLLYQICTAEVGVLPVALIHLKFQERRGRTINRNMLKSTFEDILERHKKRGHSSEIAWALWGFKAFSLTLDARLARSLVDEQDPAVSLMLLGLIGANLVQGGGADAEQAILHPLRNMTVPSAKEALISSEWLLVHESLRHGRVQKTAALGKVAHNDDDWSSWLLTNDVGFFDFDVDAYPATMFGLRRRRADDADDEESGGSETDLDETMRGGSRDDDDEDGGEDEDEDEDEDSDGENDDDDNPF